MKTRYYATNTRFSGSIDIKYERKNPITLRNSTYFIYKMLVKKFIIALGILQ